MWWFANCGKNSGIENCKYFQLLLVLDIWLVLGVGSSCVELDAVDLFGESDVDIALSWSGKSAVDTVAWLLKISGNALRRPTRPVV